MFLLIPSKMLQQHVPAMCEKQYLLTTMWLPKHFDPKGWLKSNLRVNEGHQNEGNDHQLKLLLIVKQILLLSSLANV